MASSGPDNGVYVKSWGWHEKQGCLLPYNSFSWNLWSPEWRWRQLLSGFNQWSWFACRPQGTSHAWIHCLLDAAYMVYTTLQHLCPGGWGRVGCPSLKKQHFSPKIIELTPDFWREVSSFRGIYQILRVGLLRWQPQRRDVPFFSISCSPRKGGLPGAAADQFTSGMNPQFLRQKQTKLPNPFLAEGNSCKGVGRVAGKARGKSPASVFPIASR